MSGPVWSDLQEARRHSVLPVNRTMLGCLGLWHSNVFRQVQVQFLPASVRALNRACYVKKAKQIALNRSFKCDHRALSSRRRQFVLILLKQRAVALLKQPKISSRRLRALYIIIRLSEFEIIFNFNKGEFLLWLFIVHCNCRNQFWN